MQKYVGKRDSINPDMSVAGVMPLHLAVEEGMTDMAAYLIHWKASKTRLDGSKKYPLQYAKARAASKDPKIKENGEILVKCVAAAPALCAAKGIHPQYARGADAALSALTPHPPARVQAADGR